MKQYFSGFFTAICLSISFVMFTASKNNRSLIKLISKKMNQKITRIGKINNGYKKNSIILDNKPLNLSKFKGYSHKFW